ncbi:MAG TPA: glycosyltransferase family 4 protein [Devosia sp.]|uniref:glycosyltransferase family 4 protein n=1 Tax=Devosia sp. TaxID=1871048 RepID=UPI002F92D930
MKIIQVQTQAEAAGAQRVSDMVGAGLRAKGHEVRTVFMYRKTDVYDGDPYAHFILGQPPEGMADLFRSVAGLLRYIRRERPDAVIAYQYHGVAFGTLGARLAGARHIIANQSGEPQKQGLLGLMSRIDHLYGALGLYHHSVVNSSWTEKQFGNHVPSYRRRLRRIDHGVTPPAARLDQAATRRRFGLPDDVFLAISTGRITRDKNQRALVAALALVPDLHVALAGIGPDAQPLKDLASELGAANRLHMVGEVPPAEIHHFLAAGDVFVFPTRFETFGLAGAEAAILGMPVIASDIPVLREVLTAPDGTPAAVFVQTENGRDIAAAIETLRSNPEGAQELSAAGKQLAVRYAPATMCDGYAALLS